MSKASQYSIKQEDVKKIINATTNNRDKLILELLVFTGARRYEITLLRVRDINLEDNLILMPTAKQRNENGDQRTSSELAYDNQRPIPIINSDFQRDLRGHIETLKKDGRGNPDNRLIQTRQSRSMSEVRINQIVAETAELAGVKNPNPSRKNLNPHQFRHNFVRVARKNGLDFKVIQKILGHASISTTFDMYSDPSVEDIREDMRKMDGDSGECI